MRREQTHRQWHDDERLGAVGFHDEEVAAVEPAV
jgi:hypothetical protein